MRRHGLTTFAMLALLCVAVPGCLGPLEPDVGDLEVAFCANEDSDPDSDVSFLDDIVPLLLRDAGGCQSCHLPASATPIGISVGGLDLSSYTTLLAGGVNSADDIVVPGQPCDSVLFQKLSPAPPFASRMPLSGPPFLTTSELQLVNDWIAEGADDN